MSEEQKDQGEFYMGGTDGTGKYLVLAVTAKGRVGVRDLKGEKGFCGSIVTDGFRVRVEPREVAVENIRGVLGSGWKQPGEDKQFRFSTVVPGVDLKGTVAKAFVALGVRFGSDDETQVINPEAPEWVTDLLKAKAPPA